MLKVTARVPRELRERLFLEAMRSGMTASAYCRHLLALAQESRSELELLAKQKRSVRDADLAAAVHPVCCDEDFDSAENVGGADVEESDGGAVTVADEYFDPRIHDVNPAACFGDED